MTGAQGGDAGCTGLLGCICTCGCRVRAASEGARAELRDCADLVGGREGETAKPIYRDIPICNWSAPEPARSVVYGPAVPAVTELPCMVAGVVAGVCGEFMERCDDIFVLFHLLIGRFISARGHNS